MSRRLRPIVAIVLAASLFGLLASSVSSGAPRGLPHGFFGIVPQTVLTQRDVEYMKVGGIESVRVPISWAEVQPHPSGPLNWAKVDQAVEVAARGGLEVLPFICSTPRWLANPKTLPVQNGRQRAAWSAFLQAAVKRYGPGGEFWAEHSHEGVNYEPAINQAMPVRAWQIWNEANFFYFAYPVSPSKYAKLVKLSSQAIKQVQPGAKIVLTGLFGEPTAKGARGMPAATFLQRFYKTPGIKISFDGIALHPYAVDAETLEEMVEALHDVTHENHDRPGLYITEMGWGSQNDFNKVAFEQGINGQVRQLRDSYRFLIANRSRLNLKQVYWFSWKDATGYCNFCDSVGFFRASAKFQAKPAWRAFVSLTGGRVRP
jgi:putative glycosyl hydrolase